MADNEGETVIYADSEQEAAKKAFKFWDMFHGRRNRDRFAPTREANRHGGQDAVVLTTDRGWSRLRKDDHDTENPALDLEISESGPGKTKKTYHFRYPKGKGRK